MKIKFLIILSGLLLSCTDKSNSYSLRKIELNESIKKYIDSFYALERDDIFMSDDPIIHGKLFNFNSKKYLKVSINDKYDYFFTNKGFLNKNYCVNFNDKDIFFILEYDTDIKDIIIKDWKLQTCILNFPDARGYISIASNNDFIPENILNYVSNEKEYIISSHFSSRPWYVEIDDYGKPILGTILINEKRFLYPNDLLFGQ